DGDGAPGAALARDAPPSGQCAGEAHPPNGPPALAGRGGSARALDPGALAEAGRPAGGGVLLGGGVSGRPVRLLAARPRAAPVAGGWGQRGGQAGLEGSHSRALARGAGEGGRDVMDWWAAELRCPNLLRCVGPQQVAQLRVVTSVDPTEARNARQE